MGGISRRGAIARRKSMIREQVLERGAYFHFISTFYTILFSLFCFLFCFFGRCFRFLFFFLGFMKKASLSPTEQQKKPR